MDLNYSINSSLSKPASVLSLISSISIWLIFLIEQGAIFQPAVMPSKWIGFTAADNHNAIAVANVLKKFTDEGIIVWLRFAHEGRLYPRDSQIRILITQWFDCVRFFQSIFIKVNDWEHYFRIAEISLILIISFSKLTEHILVT